MERAAPGRIRLALDVTRDLPGARISVRQGSTVVLEKTLTLSPRDVWRADVDHLTAAAVTFELVDASGTRVLAHTEKVFDRTPASEVRLGSRETEPASEGSPRSADEIVESGTLDELEGRRLAALDRYRDGLAQHPHSFALLKAAGRLSVALGWAAGGGRSPALEWLEEASARNTTDFETRYYLGLALVAAGRPRDARPHFEAAQRFRATRASGTPAIGQALGR